ncbi:putative inactive peptidyl-prolyl cis-trans isomerase-like 6 isoform 1-T4 [Synchiropus picturatus]
MHAKYHLEITGLIKEFTFAVAKSISQDLYKQFGEDFMAPTIRPLLEFAWHTFLDETRKALRGQVMQYSSSVMCFVNGQLLGNEVELSNWAKAEWRFTLSQPFAFYKDLADKSYIKHLRETKHSFVFMDIEINGEPAGRLLFELFNEACPKTIKNFEALCTGEEGLSPAGWPLCYKGTMFHRIVPNGWVQGGDISPTRRGDGGTSIYGETFEDECFAITHSRRGILGMANKGPHSNGSQFYITLQSTPWMDRKYVAFGQAVEGVDVLRKLEETPTCNQRPKIECRIVDCGKFTV